MIIYVQCFDIIFIDDFVLVLQVNEINCFNLIEIKVLSVYLFGMLLNESCSMLSVGELGRGNLFVGVDILVVVEMSVVMGGVEGLRVLVMMMNLVVVVVGV